VNERSFRVLSSRFFLSFFTLHASTLSIFSTSSWLLSCSFLFDSSRIFHFQAPRLDILLLLVLVLLLLVLLLVLLLTVLLILIRLDSRRLLLSALLLFSFRFFFNFRLLLFDSFHSPFSPFPVVVLLCGKPTSISEIQFCPALSLLNISRLSPSTSDSSSIGH
jgi:hypothetical protein